MKKTTLLLALAALFCTVGCVKVEENVFKSERQTEIGYTTIFGKMSTKSLSSNQFAFDDANVFQSYAYYLPKGTKWVYSNAAGDNGAKKYFNTDVIVSKDTENNIWRDKNNTWYWPKTNALTFFAWSLNTSSLDFPAGSPTKVTCSDQNGIVATNYDIEKNKNVDFLVADIAADKTANENIYTYVGVPTLFRHKLSMFHATVSKKENYPNIEFTLKKIEFTELNKDGDYTQYPDVMTCGSGKSNQIYTDVSQKVNSLSTNPQEVSDVNQSIYLPQDFDDDKTIVITYTIGYDTDDDGDIDITEEVTATYKLSELFGNDGFKPGTRYNLNIVFKMDEIFWDPAIEEWDENTITI